MLSLLEVSFLQSRMQVLQDSSDHSLAQGKTGLASSLLPVRFAEQTPLVWDSPNSAMSQWPRLVRQPSDPRVVISLSTVPGGVASLGPTLRSLRNQTFPADAIEVNLPRKSARGLGVYPDLPVEDAGGIDVYRTEDWLALTNVIPTLQRAQEHGERTLIVVVDDDKAYPPSLVEDHVRAHRARPRSASACRGYKMPPRGDISGAVFWPAWDELWHSFYGHRTAEAQRVAVVTGSDSWSVPAELFSESLWANLSDSSPDDGRGIKTVASLMNDIWVSGQLSRHNVPKFVVPCRFASQDTPRTVSRDAQNLEHDTLRRVALNMRVMKFFLKDWASEEMMPQDEVEHQVWQTRVRHAAKPETPASPGFEDVLQWVAHGLTRAISEVILGR